MGTFNSNVWVKPIRIDFTYLDYSRVHQLAASFYVLLYKICVQLETKFHFGYLILIVFPNHKIEFTKSDFVIGNDNVKNPKGNFVSNWTRILYTGSLKGSCNLIGRGYNPNKENQF